MAAARKGRTRPLPGGWFAVTGAGAWVRVALGQVALLWLLPWPMMLIGRFAPAQTRRRVEQRWARAVVRLLGVRLELRGLECMQPGQRYVVLALHEGLADPLPLLHLPLPLRFVARDELRSWPVVGAYLRMTRQLTVADGTRLPARKLLDAARGAVQRGESIVVFPQGSILGIQVGFRPGALRLARALGVPVLPIVISGSHRVWEHPFSPRLRLGQPVTATVLPPVEVVGLDRCRLSAAMLALERRMKDVALEPGHGAPRHYDPERDGTWDGYDFVIDPAFRDVASALPHRVRVGRRHARDAWRAREDRVERADDPVSR